MNKELIYAIAELRRIAEFYSNVSIDEHLETLLKVLANAGIAFDDPGRLGLKEGMKTHKVISPPR